MLPTKATHWRSKRNWVKVWERKWVLTWLLETLPAPPCLTLHLISMEFIRHSGKPPPQHRLFFILQHWSSTNLPHTLPPRRAGQSYTWQHSPGLAPKHLEITLPPSLFFRQETDLSTTVTWVSWGICLYYHSAENVVPNYWVGPWEAPTDLR